MDVRNFKSKTKRKKVDVFDKILSRKLEEKKHLEIQKQLKRVVVQCVKKRQKIKGYCYLCLQCTEI